LTFKSIFHKALNFILVRNRSWNQPVLLQLLFVWVLIFMEFVDIGHYIIFMEFVDIGHYIIFMEFADRCYLIGLIVIVNVTYNLKEPSYSSDKKSNAKKSKISS